MIDQSELAQECYEKVFSIDKNDLESLCSKGIVSNLIKGHILRSKKLFE